MISGFVFFIIVFIVCLPIVVLAWIAEYIEEIDEESARHSK